MENVKNYHIENFKSIKDLNLNCKRVNIFIGKSNTGKSNIIESLALFTKQNIGDALRYSSFDNLFLDNQINESIYLTLNNLILGILYSDGGYFYIVSSKDKTFNSTPQPLGSNPRNFHEKILFPIKFYKFANLIEYKELLKGPLSEPDGNNLYVLLETNNEIYEYADDLLKSYGYDLVLRQATKEIEFAKRSGRKLITFPYFLIADTLRRMIFFNTAIMTNSKSTLIFEEPESYAFPYYTKELAGTIADDENKNQYFITTHNPYFLKTIVDKTKSDELCVFYTYYKDYQTYVKELPKDKLIQFFLKPDIDIFLNIDKFEETL